MLSHFSHVQLFVTLWTVALQALLSMGFSRQEYWNGLPCAPPGDLPNPGIEPGFPALQADSLPLVPPRKPIIVVISSKNVQVQVQTFISTYDELPDNLQSSGQVPALTQWGICLEEKASSHSYASCTWQPPSFRPVSFYWNFQATNVSAVLTFNTSKITGFLEPGK